MSPAAADAKRAELEQLLQLLVGLGIAMGQNAGFPAWCRSHVDLHPNGLAGMHHDLTVAGYAMHARAQVAGVVWGSTHDLPNSLRAFSDLIIDGEYDNYEDAADAALKLYGSPITKG